MTAAKGWAIDPQPWLSVLDATKECTWRRVNLDADNRRLVPEEAGVYVMCVSTKDLHFAGKLFDALTAAIYVGQASNLRARFSQHVRGDRPGLKQAIQTFRRISFYFTTLDRGSLSHVEQSLIDALGPSVNAINATRAQVGGIIKAQLDDGVALGKRYK